jgi:hypothetical protein
VPTAVGASVVFLEGVAEVEVVVDASHQTSKRTAAASNVTNEFLRKGTVATAGLFK